MITTVRIAMVLSELFASKTVYISLVSMADMSMNYVLHL